jgi:DNA invertase Pin-like site-specific DNA recombinase
LFLRDAPVATRPSSFELGPFLRHVDETKPQTIVLRSPEEVQRLRGEGWKVYRVLTRVSDDKLLSIPDQIRECVAYAHGEHVANARRADAEATPGTVDVVYNFGTQSGFTLFESALFKELLAASAGSDFNGFIARDSSRLGRDYWDKFATLGLLRRSGKELHVIEDGGLFDYEDDMTKVRSWADTWSDSKKKMEEIRKSIRATARLREERIPTTSLPYGYESAPAPQGRHRVWRPTPEAAAVKAMFAAVDASPGAPRIRDLARAHNVSPQLVRKILRNRAYTGGFNWAGEFVRCPPEAVPPLVDEALFERVQMKMRPNDTK